MTSALRGHRRQHLRGRNKNGGTGAAYAFQHDDGGATYGQVAKLTAADAARTNDRFGILRGDRRQHHRRGRSSIWLRPRRNTVVVYGSELGLGLRLPHDRRRRHVHPGGLSEGLDAAANDYFGYGPWPSTAILSWWVPTTRTAGDPGRSTGVCGAGPDGGATYGQVAKLTADDAENYDRFGTSVAIDGGTVVVGPLRREARLASSGSPTSCDASRRRDIRQVAIADRYRGHTSGKCAQRTSDGVQLA